MSEPEEMNCEKNEVATGIYNAFVSTRTSLKEMITSVGKIEPESTSLVTINSIFGMLGMLNNSINTLETLLGEKLILIEKHIIEETEEQK